MRILPAIDLMEGCAVRLVRGDYAQKTVYSETPALLAKDFQRAGAEWLHVVDLDGAKRGAAANRETVEAIVRESGLRVELGGGIRDMDTLEAYLAMGVKRIILGTAAVEDEAFLHAALRRHGDAVAVGMDVRGGRVAVRGWLEESGEGMEDFCARLEDAGVNTVICTDISRDGMLGGSNMALYRSLCARHPRINFIASGGVSGLHEIRTLRDMGLYGAIVGKALYTGALDLRAALAAGKGEAGAW